MFLLSSKMQSTKEKDESKKHSINESFSFNWNDNNVELICLGYVRSFLPQNIQIRHITQIITRFTACHDLQYIHLPAYTNIDNDRIYIKFTDSNNENANKKTQRRSFLMFPSLKCNFNCNVPITDHTQNTARSRGHGPSVIVFKPSIDLLLQANIKGINKNNAYGKQRVKSLRLIIALTHKECTNQQFRNGGYLLQCGLLTIAKTDSQIAKHVRQKKELKAIAKGDYNYSINIYQENLNQLSDLFKSKIQGFTNGWFAMYQLRNLNTKAIFYDDKKFEEYCTVAQKRVCNSLDTKYIVFSQVGGVRQCASNIDGKSIKYNKNYFLEKNDFVQLCIQRIKTKNDHDGGNHLGYEYEFIVRKGTLDTINVNNNKMDKDINKDCAYVIDQSKMHTVYQNGFVLKDSFDYAFCMSSVRCVCENKVKGFEFQVFLECVH